MPVLSTVVLSLGAVLWDQMTLPLATPGLWRLLPCVIIVPYNVWYIVRYPIKEVVMSKSKAAAPAKATPVASAPAPFAVLAATTASTPVRRGESTIAKPVATTWVLCLNACFPGGQPVATPPVRKVLVGLALEAGVAYYTARTQVDRFLRASQGGTVVPTTGLPQGVAFDR